MHLHDDAIAHAEAQYALESNEENWQAVVRAREQRDRAELDARVREQREQAARDAEDAERKADLRITLDALVADNDRDAFAATIKPLVREIVELDRRWSFLVRKVQRAAEHQRDAYEEGAAMAGELGDTSYPLRMREVSDTDAAYLVQVALGQARAEEERDDMPWHQGEPKPDWRDAEKVSRYEQALALLDDTDD